MWLNEQVDGLTDRLTDVLMRDKGHLWEVINVREQNFTAMQQV